MTRADDLAIRTHPKSRVAHLFNALGFPACGVDADTVASTRTDRPCKRCQRLVPEVEWPAFFRQLVIWEREL